MATNRRWLILSYFSDIDTLACSHHLDDRIPELRKLGIEPIVITGMCSPPNPELTKIRIPSAAPSGLRYEMRYVTRRMFANKAVRRLAQFPMLLALLPAYALESLLLNFECTWSWYPTAAAVAARAARKYGAEMIYSPGGASSAHLAALLCARRTGLPWIAEFQDPVVGEWVTRRRFEQRRNFRLERAVARKADAVVYMTEKVLERAEARTSMGDRGHFIYPGANSHVFDGVQAEPKPDGKLVMGHFGSFGGNRNAGPVLESLKKLVAKHPDAANDVTLLLLGDMDRAQERMLEEFPYQGMLDVRWKRPRAESLSAMLACDVLLLIQNESPMSIVTIPSKTYEYLHAGSAVFALTYQSPELERMLRGLGHSAFDYSELDVFDAAVEQAYLNWKAGRPVTAPISPSPYTTESAARALLGIAGDVIEARKGGGR